MAKTSKGVILSQASQIKSDYSFALIKATADNKSLVQDASSAELKVNALVEYSKDSQWDPKKLTNLGFPAGCFLIVDLRGQDIHAADLITNLALVRQYGYQAGVIDDLSTLDDIKVLKANQIYLINSGKTNDDQDASLNGNEITDGSGKLAVGMSVKWQRDYTNVDVSGDHAGFVGMGQDTLLKGGNAFGYSTNGRDFNAVITPKGLIFRRPDAERMWRLLKPNEIADINSTVGDKVKKEVDSATAEIPAAVSAANSAVSAAESAVAASKVNSDAIVAQSEAISEAKSAMDSATAEIQQTAANAASDAAKIRADVAQVQSEVDTAKAANSASVEALKSDINTAKQDLATVHDSLTKAQATAEQNQKAINDSIAEINANVDATNQDLAGVRKDLTKAQSDITANQKAVNDNVAQINSNIEQDRKDIASAQQANADTAKQLDTYSKQATEQGKTIKTIQDKQDGFTATLADVQGNVSQVSDKVDGLSASLKDTQGNVASVKAQADQLSATLTNHGKSIATLTASAKELSSTLEDADGRLSKVEQTAQTNSSTLSDVQGDLSQVKQNATKLVSTLKDAQGNISTLQQKADSLSTQLASAQGDIATFQTGIDGVKAILTSHDKSIHTLQADSKSLKDSMTNAQGDISTLQKSATSLDSEMKDHAGRLSKVEQNAATQATTLSDLQGNLTQVKQQADGLVTTLKDAQGDIAKVQTTAKGLSEQITNAQGAITDLQTDVTGVKATIADHDKNIHTLQADNKTLKDDMTDAKGNISSLQKTSTSLTSEMQDHSGRLSKVEQTATEHTSELADTKGNLDKVTQKANNLQLLLSDAQKNIQNIQLDAKGLHDTLTGQSNQLASLNVTLNNLDSKYSGITGDLQSKQTALSTEQQQTKDMLLNKADKSEVDNVKGTVNQVSAEQKVMADQINQKVSSVEYQTLKDKVNGMKVGGRNLLIGTSENEISGKAYNFADYQISGGLQPNKTYTLSGWARVDQDSLNHHQNVFIDAYSEDWSWAVGLNISSSLTSQYNKITFTTPSGKQLHPYVTVYLSHPDGGTNENNNDAISGMAFIKKLKLEEGDFDTDYTHAPEDTITAIQKNATAIDENSKLISLMAKQTEVDNVKNTAQQISSRLDILAGEVKSKVDETRVNNIVDGKGYATTSTVQSLVDQKAGTLSDTITELDRKIGDNHSDSIKRIQSLTASIDGLQSRVTNYQNDTSSKYTQLSNLMQSKVGTADFEQLKRSVDMQTLDSADINNMKTNGHYFVHNLTNSPIAGWVYVDVTGNGNNRIRQDVYQDNGIQHKYRRWVDTHWTGWEEGATYTEITQLQDAVNLRVQKGELLSQINLTAGNTLIQSNKLYLDASSVVITGTAFIPSAAIASLSADKINTGCLNTNDVSLGDGRTRIRADHDYMYIQPTGSAASNTGIRMGYSGLDFLTNVIPNGYNSSVPYYSIGYDGASNGYLRISAFDHINPGGATATQNWFTMVDAISLTNSEINFATKGNMHMQVFNGGVNIKPTLFFQNNTNNGTWAGFTRGDNSDIVEFSTGDNNGENFRIDCGARFMQYVYINGNARAQSWLTNSTLSKKTNIRKLDQQIALDKIRQDDQYLYEYKRNIEQGIYDPQASFIIDDVNDVSHYSVPREFIDQSGNYREPNVELAYLIAAFQAIDKQVQKQKEEIKELKEKLQHE